MNLINGECGFVAAVMRLVLALVAFFVALGTVLGAGEAPTPAKPALVDALLGDVSIAVYDKDADKPSNVHTFAENP